MRLVPVPVPVPVCTSAPTTRAFPELQHRQRHQSVLRGLDGQYNTCWNSRGVACQFASCSHPTACHPEMLGAARAAPGHPRRGLPRVVRQKQAKAVGESGACLRRRARRRHPRRSRDNAGSVGNPSSRVCTTVIAPPCPPATPRARAQLEWHREHELPERHIVRTERHELSLLAGRAEKHGEASRQNTTVTKPASSLLTNSGSGAAMPCSIAA
jgi:hypothetical protein